MNITPAPGVSRADLANTSVVTKGAALVGTKLTNQDGDTHLTGAVARTVCQVIAEAPLSVRAFGATGDGVTDDQPAIQDAIDALPVTGGSVYFPPGEYKINSTIALPTTLPGGTPIQTLYHIHGPGAKLTTSAAIDMMAQAMPTSADNANDRTVLRFHVNGLQFVGTSDDDQRGLVLAANYGNLIENCVFQELGTGLDLLFSLMGQVRGCFAEWCTQHGYRIRAGTDEWTGATGSNSCSNHTVLKSCHAGCVTGQLTGYLFQDSSGCALEDSICEGGSPINAVSYDSRSVGTSQTFFIKNLHVECNPVPTNAMVKIVAVNHVDINGLFLQDVGTVIDSTGSNAQGLLTVQGIPNFPAGCQFKCTGGASIPWWFYGGVGAYRYVDVLDSAYWVGGTVPYYGYAKRMMGTDDSPLYENWPVDHATRLGQKGTVTTVT